jgi:integrase
MFSDHWPNWIEHYSGRTGGGFRETTRAEYRRDLKKEAEPFFGRMKLAEIEPRHIKEWLTGLAGRGLSASTIRGILAPLRAMLAEASEEGLIRSNPAAGVRVPSLAKTAEQKDKALTVDEVQRLRAVITKEEDLLLVDFLIVTGLRISEAIALNLGDVDLGRCWVAVTKRFYKGFDAPKTRYGRRDVPITPELGQRVWELRKARPNASDEDPLFVSPKGRRLDYANAYNRIIKPAMRKAGITWGGAHRLRHTAATHLVRSGASANQAQLWLGHHDPGFTARTYVHLGTSDLPDPAIFDSLLAQDGQGLVVSPDVQDPQATSLGA